MVHLKIKLYWRAASFAEYHFSPVGCCHFINIYTKNDATMHWREMVYSAKPGRTPIQLTWNFPYECCTLFSIGGCNSMPLDPYINQLTINAEVNNLKKNYNLFKFEIKEKIKTTSYAHLMDVSSPSPILLYLPSGRCFLFCFKWHESPPINPEYSTELAACPWTLETPNLILLSFSNPTSLQISKLLDMAFS